MSDAPHRPLISFGAYEVNVETGELRKAGLRVKLQGLPFRVLMTLVSKPGELITREELQREVWGRDTTIDFERGISSAINKVREALGDSAESPRYVETLAKRGYRFIAPVRLESAPSQGLESEQSGESTPLLNPPEISAPIATFSCRKDRGLRQPSCLRQRM